MYNLHTCTSYEHVCCFVYFNIQWASVANVVVYFSLKQLLVPRNSSCNSCSCYRSSSYSSHICCRCPSSRRRWSIAAFCHRFSAWPISFWRARERRKSPAAIRSRPLTPSVNASKNRANHLPIHVCKLLARIQCGSIMHLTKWNKTCALLFI